MLPSREYADESAATVGLVLAAGRGSRYGMPKALVEDANGRWLDRAINVLNAGGCDRVVVTLGAQADSVLPLLPGDVESIVVPDFEEGMGASLRAGIAAALRFDPATVVVTLVDLPDLVPEVVGRLLASPGMRSPSALGRAAYDSVPGHPVVLGRDHLAEIQRSAHGDQGARSYLGAHEVALIECGDLARGADVDEASDGYGHGRR